MKGNPLGQSLSFLPCVCVCVCQQEVNDFQGGSICRFFSPYYMKWACLCPDTTDTPVGVSTTRCTLISLESQTWSAAEVVWMDKNGGGGGGGSVLTFAFLRDISPPLLYTYDEIVSNSGVFDGFAFRTGLISHFTGLTRMLKMFLGDWGPSWLEISALMMHICQLLIHHVPFLVSWDEMRSGNYSYNWIYVFFFLLEQNAPLSNP